MGIDKLVRNKFVRKAGLLLITITLVGYTMTSPAMAKQKREKRDLIIEVNEFRGYLNENNTSFNRVHERYLRLFEDYNNDFLSDLKYSKQTKILNHLDVVKQVFSEFDQAGMTEQENMESRMYRKATGFDLLLRSFK